MQVARAKATCRWLLEGPHVQVARAKAAADGELKWRQHILSDCVAGGVGMPLTHLFEMVAMTSSQR